MSSDTMRPLGLKVWHWLALVLLGLWVGAGAGSTAELLGSVLGALLLGVLFVYLKRGIRNRFETSG